MKDKEEKLTVARKRERLNFKGITIGLTIFFSIIKVKI
jgi:hypothetical protein